MAPKRAIQRGTWGVPGLLMHERLFFQSQHLLLVAMIHYRLDWQDGVQVVAVPLHAVVINIVGVLNSDKPLILQLCDVLHHRGR